MYHRKEVRNKTVTGRGLNGHEAVTLMLRPVQAVQLRNMLEHISIRVLVRRLVPDQNSPMTKPGPEFVVKAYSARVEELGVRK